jgi:hypothetical protein
MYVCVYVAGVLLSLYHHLKFMQRQTRLLVFDVIKKWIKRKRTNERKRGNEENDIELGLWHTVRPVNYPQRTDVVPNNLLKKIRIIVLLLLLFRSSSSDGCWAEGCFQFEHSYTVFTMPKQFGILGIRSLRSINANCYGIDSYTSGYLNFADKFQEFILHFIFIHTYHLSSHLSLISSVFL